MNNEEKILRPVASLFGGAYLPHLKATAEEESIVMPPPNIVKIPMLQNIGAPAEPIVNVGDKVHVGTLIGKQTGFVSALAHSSVSGTVKAIEDYETGAGECKCVVIESDGLMTVDPIIKPFSINTREDVAEAARYCGLVGLGGAGFPTHIKLTIKDETPIDTLIINGAECEPYITSDYRECIENYDDVIEGVYLLKEKLGISKVIICIESNKKAAIEKLYQIASDKRDFDDTVKLMKLPTAYPQGAEKMIIYSATGRKVPLGKLPSDVGCIVMNITSVATLYRFTKDGMPLIKKRITVDGTAIENPKNVIVPIGTSFEDVLNFVGETEAAEIIRGGPMMGVDSENLTSVVEKRTNALTVMKEEKPVQVTACIRCGRCAKACPMNLYPASVEAAINHDLLEQVEKLNVNYCMECGCCSFVCPAKRPLAQVMKLAKAKLKKEGKK